MTNKYKYKLLLLCDHKWRDLPNLVVLKYYLNLLGHHVIICSTKDTKAMIYYHRPNCVVFNHLLSSDNVKMATILKKKNIKIVVLPTEGAGRPEFREMFAGEFSNYNLVDLYFTWSKKAADAIKKIYNFKDNRIKFVGYNRLDFYHQNFKKIIDSRKEFCEKYKLDPKKPIVTWATQYGYAYLKDKKNNKKLIQWLYEIKDVGLDICYKRIGLNPKNIPNLFFEGRKKTSISFFKITKLFPKVQFLIKPHPTEDIEFYKNLIKKYNCQNVFFCPNDYIWNVLNATDIELHRHCTTAIEFWAWEKPTIEMGMDFVPQWAWKERENGSDVAFDEFELEKLLKKYLKNPKLSDHKLKIRKKYIKKWFGEPDGQRIKDTSEILNCFLRDITEMPKKIKVKDFNFSWTNVIKTLIKFYFNKKPNEKILFGKRNKFHYIAFDKLITRSDVMDYERKVNNLNL